jgi:GNAT superfamily N-acetyltransferase
MHIRRATIDDKKQIAAIWRANADMLGGVVMQAINKGIASRQLHVAEIDGELAGFVEYHTRRDGVSVIYHIAVVNEYRGQDVGRWLVWSVPCPVRLKVTADNERAIRFYKRIHFQQIAQETTKKGRELLVMELRSLFIQCAGNNRKFPDICRATGIAYGSRHDDQFRAQPFMMDINWKKYDWSDYLRKIETHRPVMAMVPDYERPEQRRMLYQQIRDLKARGVLRIMVCPKWDGAIAHIPSWCVVAVSVPSGYAGYIPPLHQLKGRNVHLLGGSPKKQREYMLKIAGVGGRVVSVDGNSHTRMQSMIWNGSQWKSAGGNMPYYDMVEYGARNIASSMQTTAEYKQLPLFVA